MENTEYYTETASDDAPAYPSSRELLTQYATMINIADLGDDLEQNCDLTLDQIGKLVVEEYGYDEQSRQEWLDRNENGLKLAKQLRDNRKYAGEPISDVKYPTIAAAAIQYAARALPAIVKDEEVVKYRPVGADPQGIKAARGARVAQYMNYELLEVIENWEEDMDKLLFAQPVAGIYFKKIYHDPVERKCKVELIAPEDLVVYYMSPSFEGARRKTQIIYMTHNEYVEHVRAGAFIDVDLQKPDEQDEAGFHKILEQHRLLDLDGDGYDEPYIVTVHEETEQVLRIKARYEQQNIEYNSGDQVRRITPIEYFVAYPFMPSFDGGVYGMGFGILLGPLNESINTLFNQMIDAGTRSVFSGGFIGKGVRLLRGAETGTIKFKRDEWKQVASTGDDLRKSIVPLPRPEVSSVLFQLLGFLVQASKELSSQSELLAGQQQQHNVPATSTLALIEQGLMVFSGIYKRVYRSLRSEYKRLHRLKGKVVTPQEYQTVLDDPQADVADFATADYDIRPVSTTAAVTETQKYLKAQALLQLAGRGLDDAEINKFYLESIGIPNIPRFLPKAPPPPPPQFVIAMRELDIRQFEAETNRMQAITKDAEIAAKIREMRDRGIKLRADSMEAIAKAESLESGQRIAAYKQVVDNLLSQVFALEKDLGGIDKMRVPMAPPAAVKMPPQQQAPGPQGGQQPQSPPGPAPTPPPQGGTL